MPPSDQTHSTGSGTSTRVEGKRPVYPPFSTWLLHALEHLKGCFLAALFCNYIVFNSVVGLSALVVPSSPFRIAAEWLADTQIFAWIDVKLMSAAAGGSGGTRLDLALFLMLQILIHETLYICFAGGLVACDHYGWLQRWKLPRTKRMAAPPGLLFNTLKEAAFNHLVVQPAVLVLLYTRVSRFPSFFADAQASIVGASPSLMMTFVHMVGAQAVNELGFYAAHRAVHEIPGAYVRIHKQHHSWVGSVGVAAEYAHPIEQVLANQLPTALYCLLLVSHVIHPFVWFMWLGWRLWETYEAHSGYCFRPSWPQKMGLLHADRTEFHDWHHSDNRGCYGSWMIDWMFGTMDSWLIHKAADGKPPKETAGDGFFRAA